MHQLHFETTPAETNQILVSDAMSRHRHGASPFQQILSEPR